MNKYVLKLYITGRTTRSEKAIANMQLICKQVSSERYQLVVIYVLENPKLAEDEKILETPKLIKELPPPRRLIIGDLSDREKVLLGLDMFSMRTAQ